jgi:Flp pilus assembly protein TadG
MRIFHTQIAHMARKRLLSVRTDSEGIALLEFAITLPVLLTLYLGCVQICDVVSVYRKTTTTARTVADLTSQQTEVSDATLQDIMDVSSQVMSPHSTSKLRIVVTQVSVTSAGVVKVDWSKSSGTGAVSDTIGSTYTLPTGVAVNSTSLIISKVNYGYLADIGGLLHTDIPLADTIYMYPRAIVKIPKT